ncbi:glycoside hydrolase family 3 protein [Maridesulfovibrio zosterae]|uniref:glycoside hydrolase family 3 protein n=1 Tax=Maridesulfovibrio zosterae TaxID=82171 RepID=UPI0004030DA6|nr:glycoside hydrolase family 3 protein [Maridesulfovibrio zosterae]
MTRIFPLLLILIMIISGCALHSNSGVHSELDKMVGQMVMVGFRGMTADSESLIAQDIRNSGIGGVILFNKDCALNSTVRNISGPDQLKRLTSSLQSYADIPLFIGIDQEGGIITRLTAEAGFMQTPSAAELGNSGDKDAAFRAGKSISSTLASEGINMNFAPVVDVNCNAVNPVISGLQRSFSDDPEIVADFAESFINGLHSENVFSCLKHFPGHGSSVGDSHKGFTDVSETWSSNELYPFKKLIKDGKADMVMTAHIFNKKLDRDYPATLSRKVITGLLRRKLGFEGIIITDDMQMAAVSSQYGFKDAIDKAVHAGADILLFGNNLIYEPALGTKAVNVLKELVLEGKITEQRIKRSYDRIMFFKNRLN